MDDLQFERAEFGQAPAAACTGCHQPMAASYFDVNGRPFCPACTTAIQQAHGANPGGAALARALGAGVGAGALGSALYYIVERISGYRLSIIFIAVGFLVGRAVRWAAGGRGGVPYQVLAVALTYAAIAFSWLPFVIASSPETPGLLDVVLSTPSILALPIRLGLERPFSLVIIGIGLYEAWTFTAPVRLAISGPFDVAPPARPAALPPIPTPAP